MTDMLSVVARAMAELNEPGIWDRPEGPPDEFWRSGYLRDAKAAIEAMRSPTDEMLEAAFEAVYYEESLLGDWRGWVGSNRKRWQAMIDKALEGKDADN